MRVTLLEPFAREFFGGETELECEARNLFALVRALDAKAPGFAEAVEQRAAVAVDGVHVADWSASLAGVGEVLIVPRIAGGQGWGR